MAEIGKLLEQQRREIAEELMVEIIARFGKYDKPIQDKLYKVKLKLLRNEPVTEDDIKLLRANKLY